MIAIWGERWPSNRHSRGMEIDEVLEGWVGLEGMGRGK